jgi:hypothetical protein
MYRISLSLIYELAKALGKSEDEVRQFLEALRQRLPWQLMFTLPLSATWM